MNNIVMLAVNEFHYFVAKAHFLSIFVYKLFPERKTHFRTNILRTSNLQRDDNLPHALQMLHLSILINNTDISAFLSTLLLRTSRNLTPINLQDFTEHVISY
jgi:hypothetical protein